MIDMQNPSGTSLSELGEFGLIKRLTQNIVLKNSGTIKGVGDDAAVLKFGEKYCIVTTDMLIEGVHFDLSYVPLKHLGYKSVVVNLSDVYAMNAQPKQITVSIAVSNRFTLEALDELYKGIKLACEKYGIDLVGGDTTSSVTGMLISITALGEAEPDEIVYRNTAKVNDLICVSGDLGAAYTGLQLLEREKLVFKTNPKMQPELTGNEYILERQLKPEARKDIIQSLKNIKVKPTSMIDISDGLSSELLHICTGSGVGCRIYEDKIPIAPETIKMAEEMNIDPTTCALNGGEDYELLFTVSLKDHDMIKENPGISPIGYITEANTGYNLIARSGQTAPLTAQGWNALLKNK
ncbi:MAG: thiamine-phosphate kinase [Bacteroidia bacterium]|nr:thiamine-phosphate kinase [Bacteroidia bacterium]